MRWRGREKEVPLLNTSSKSLRPFPPSFSIFLYMDVKQNRMRATPSCSPSCGPLHTRTKPCCAQNPNTTVVSNLALTPLNAHKQGCHPLPLTIWGPPLPRLSSWLKNPFTTPLPPTLHPQDPADPASLDSLCHQTAVKDGDQLLLTESKEGLMGNKLSAYLLFPVWYAYDCVCVWVFASFKVSRKCISPLHQTFCFLFCDF